MHAGVPVTAVRYLGMIHTFIYGSRSGGRIHEYPQKEGAAPGGLTDSLNGFSEVVAGAAFRPSGRIDPERSRANDDCRGANFALAVG